MVRVSTATLLFLIEVFGRCICSPHPGAFPGMGQARIETILKCFRVVLIYVAESTILSTLLNQFEATQH